MNESKPLQPGGQPEQVEELEREIQRLQAENEGLKKKIKDLEEELRASKPQAAWTESGTGRFPKSAGAGGVNRRRDRGSGSARRRLPALRRRVGGGSRRVGDHDRSSGSTATGSHPLPRASLSL